MAGILIEIRGEVCGPSYAVIGIGINFNLSKSIIPLIGQRVTDLSSVTGNLIDRNLVLGKLLSELYNVLDDFAYYGFSYFKKEWISYHSYEGCEVDLIIPNGLAITGIVDGVTDTPFSKRQHSENINPLPKPHCQIRPSRPLPFV